MSASVESVEVLVQIVLDIFPIAVGMYSAKPVLEVADLDMYLREVGALVRVFLCQAW